MDVTRILDELRAERERIDKAINALEALGVASSASTRVATQTAAKKQRAVRKSASAPKATNGRRRRLSAAARKAISDAAKRRWAEHREKNSRKAAA